MRLKPVFLGGLLAAAFMLIAVTLAWQTSLAASTVRCLRYHGDLREQCMKQGSPATRGKQSSMPFKRPPSRQPAAQPSLPPRQYAIKDSHNVLPAVTDADHIRGSRQSSVLIIEYVDFECPFCKKHLATLNHILSTYGNTVSLVVRHFPLPSHANAFKEAEAAECAAIYGGNEGFWKYHDELFVRTKSGGAGFPVDGLTPLATELGIPLAGFMTCMQNSEALSIVNAQFAAGKVAGVTATPTVFVIDVSSGTAHKILGAVLFARYEAIIDEILKK